MIEAIMIFNISTLYFCLTSIYSHSWNQQHRFCQQTPYITLASFLNNLKFHETTHHQNLSGSIHWNDMHQFSQSLPHQRSHWNSCDHMHLVQSRLLQLGTNGYTSQSSNNFIDSLTPLTAATWLTLCTSAEETPLATHWTMNPIVNANVLVFATKLLLGLPLPICLNLLS